MPDREGRDKGQAAKPQSFPETKPFESSVSAGWFLEATLELQRSFGRVEKAIENLEKAGDKYDKSLDDLRSSIEDKLEKQRKSISTLQKTVWGAMGGVGVIVWLIEHFLTHR